MMSRRSRRPDGRVAVLVALVGLGFGLPAVAGDLVRPAVGQGKAAPAPKALFEHRPGQMEFSGEMIVRPLQSGALAARGLDPLAAAQARARAGNRLAVDTLRYYPEVDEYIVKIPAGEDENTYSARLMATGDYQYAHPNYICYPVGEPNDPLFAQQWHHVNMEAAAAWDITQGASDYITAFCDTGIDVNHPDLAAHRVPGYNAPSDLAEVDGGQVNDVNGHGTHVAGCAGAIGNNAEGVAGANWNSRLMMCRVTNDAGGGASYENLFRAARWAADNGAKSISTSYTGVQSQGVQTTGEYCRSKGALYLYAADNYNQNHSGFDWPDVIVVGASDQGDNKAGFSSYGVAIDVFTPGVDILAPVNGGGYQAWSGTSMATPVTNGLCALIWSINPNFTSEMVEGFLEQGCDSMGNQDLYGFGRTNSLRSVQLALEATGPQAPFAVDDDAESILPESILIDVLANDFDVNGDPIEIESFDASSILGGTVSAEGGMLRYTPPQQVGEDSFTYTITDNLDGSDTATVRVDLVDPSDFRDPDSTGPTEAGAAVGYYVAEGYSFLPDFDALTPYLEEVVPQINYQSTGGNYAGSGRADNVGAVYTGYIVVPKTAVYTLYTNSDDGSALWIGDQMVVNNDGLHGMVEIGGAIGLKAGPHEFRVEFWENGGGAGLIVSLAGGGIAKAPIAADLFIHGADCAADLEADGTLDLFDFLAFVNLFNAQDDAADWDGNGTFDLFDFLGYVNSFNAGC
jgi:subtilisin family serine protease